MALRVYIALKVNSARLFPSSHELANPLLAGTKKTARTAPARRRSLLHTEKVLRRLVRATLARRRRTSGRLANCRKFPWETIPYDGAHIVRCNSVFGVCNSTRIISERRRSTGELTTIHNPALGGALPITFSIADNRDCVHDRKRLYTVQ